MAGRIDSENRVPRNAERQTSVAGRPVTGSPVTGYTVTLSHVIPAVPRPQRCILEIDASRCRRIPAQLRQPRARLNNAR
jgi:hypothetical protein